MARQRAWSSTVAGAVGKELRAPHLRFFVSSFTRGGNFFDIDNLAKPVLDAIAPRAVSVWVEVMQSSNPGLLVEEVDPPAPPPFDASVYLAAPPTKSARLLSGVAELTNRVPVGTASQPIGLCLGFDDPETRVGDFDFAGPIKKVIDVLWPLLGGSARSPADHRIRDLRIARGLAPGRLGVTVNLWLADHVMKTAHEDAPL